jgi:NADH-quinone oxidoreductase subunit J
MTLSAVYFYACTALAVAGALGVVIAKNPIRSAMGLLLLILSVAGLFLSLHAQFLAAVQLIVYAGAIVVLFLFVIMLLGPNAAPPSDRRGIVVRSMSGALLGLGGTVALFIAAHAMRAGHPEPPLPNPAVGFGGIEAFGDWLFSDALVPFELSSALLMVAVVGAVAVARGRQGVASLSKSEQQAARAGQPPSISPQENSGVYSHEVHLGDPAGRAS